MVHTDIQFSFVIPTYNRAALVEGAVRSALAWLGAARDGEIVVVDDGSSDGTSSLICRHFDAELRSGRLRLLQFPRNMGVVKAKNAGAREAKGKWIIFLDSDDEMIPDSRAEMCRDCAKFADAPVVFFSCCDFLTGERLGPARWAPVRLTLREYLNGPTMGECLPVVRNDAARKAPYDERLDGWEGLAYARMLRQGGRMAVSPVFARKYRSYGEDRLSSAQGLRRRRRSLARGHWFLLLEFGGWMPPRRFILQMAKVIVYGGASLI